MAKFSVIIPAYNVEKYITDCLESICNQSLKDIEIIVIDDCSTDRTLEIIESFAEKDTRIHVLKNEKNCGQATSRNKALDIAEGEYIQFLDSDDMLDEKTLESVYHKMNTNDLDVVYYDILPIYENEELRAYWEPRLHKRRLSQLYEISNGIQYMTRTLVNDDWRSLVTRCSYKRRFIKSNNLKFAEGRIHEDDCLSFCSVLRAERVCNMRGDFYIRRFRSGSTMTSSDYYKKCRSRISNVLEMENARLEAISTHELSREEKASIETIVERQAKSTIKLYNKLTAEEQRQIEFTDEQIEALYNVNKRIQKKKNKEIKKANKLGFIRQEKLLKRKHPYIDLLRFCWLKFRWGIKSKTWFKHKLYKRANTPDYIHNRMKYKRSWGRVAAFETSKHNFVWRIFHYIRFGIFRLIYPGMDAEDYFDYHFYDMTKGHSYRKTFITEGRLGNMIEAFNGTTTRQDREILDNKKLFNQFFSDMVNRDSISIEENIFDAYIIRKFCTKHKKVIAKPLKGVQGKNIFVQDIVDENSIEELIEKTKKGCWIIEEYVEQCKEMMSLNPTSVNTIRVYTIRDNNEIFVTCTVLRIGSTGSVVDNYCSGGIAALLDTNTGVAYSFGKYKRGDIVYEAGTGVKLEGFIVPVWNEVIDMCKKAHSRTDNFRYIAWDVAIDKNYKTILIEGNNHGGIGVQQSLDLEGKKPMYQKFLHNGEKL